MDETGKDDFSGDKKVGQSILHKWEERMVAYVTPKMPLFIETYHLTLLTLLWSFLILCFGYLAQYNIQWLWGSTVVIVLQYLTDVFDGALGRYRNTGLIKWGYYMDHFLDYIFLSAMITSYTFFIPDSYNITFYIMVVFGAYLVNAYLNFAITNRFRVTYFGIGPTEGRLVFILANTLLIIDKVFLAQFLPLVLIVAFVGLCMVVYRTQRKIWKMDVKIKEGKRNSHAIR